MGFLCMKKVERATQWIIFFYIFCIITGSGVGGFGGGGGGYHLGSGDALDALNGYHRERSGSDGDGEEDSPPTQHRAPPHLAHLGSGPGVPLGVPLGLGNPSNSLTIGQAAQLTQQQLHGTHHEYAGIGGPPHHSHHMSSQSLRRSRARPQPPSQQPPQPQPVHYQSPANVVGPAHSSNQSSSQIVQENPYQQPYTGRGAGLSDSPTSENASDATLTDSELPFANTTSALPLQNGKTSPIHFLSLNLVNFTTIKVHFINQTEPKKYLYHYIQSHSHYFSSLSPLTYTHLSMNHDATLTHQKYTRTSHSTRENCVPCLSSQKIPSRIMSLYFFGGTLGLVALFLSCFSPNIIKTVSKSHVP